MVTQLSLMPCHTQRMCRSRTFLPSILQKNIRGHNNCPHPQFFFIALAINSVNNSRWTRRSSRSMVNATRSDAPKGSKSATRLIRTVHFLQSKLISRFKELRNGLSVKVLFFLVGFYCATAFATVIGQTGDWDILSAGLAVVVVEGIGAAMYQASSRLFSRIKGLITMFNYWKAGLTLGLFLDSFKYEMDTILDNCNVFSIYVDIFHVLL